MRLEREQVKEAIARGREVIAAYRRHLQDELKRLPEREAALDRWEAANERRA